VVLSVVVGWMVEVAWQANIVKAMVTHTSKSFFIGKFSFRGLYDGL
jgi:hypothetical protein